MTALDLLDDSYPHGTVEGYDQGCRTNHCPAPITCTIFRTRYVGDWAFRKMVDGGMTAADIVAREAVKPVAPKRERPAPRPVRAGEKDDRGRVRKTNITRRRFTADDLQLIRTLHGEGLNDTQIGARFTPPRPANSVRDKRIGMGLPTIGKPWGRNVTA